MLYIELRRVACKRRYSMSLRKAQLDEPAPHTTRSAKNQ